MIFILSTEENYGGSYLTTEAREKATEAREALHFPNSTEELCISSPCCDQREHQQSSPFDSTKTSEAAAPAAAAISQILQSSLCYFDTNV